jgi:thiamine-phosphate pyrophosphorylase
VKEKIFRIIDANLNRSREGLRVCEDVARFVLDCALLAKQLKSARHRISALAKKLSYGSNILYRSRDSQDDPGKALRLKSELTRKGLADIFNANMERSKESLRVLEEFSKLVDLKLSRSFSRLRFEVYDIEKRGIKKIAALRNTR